MSTAEKMLKTIFKKILLNVPGFQLLCRRLTSDHVRVLMYHRFSPEGEWHPRRLPAPEFAWQLDHLVQHHRLFQPDDQLDLHPGFFSKRNRPPVIITVDDGYEDFSTVAFPLLMARNAPATVFITTGFLSGRDWFWWDKLHWILENCGSGYRTFHFAGKSAEGDPGEEASRWELWHRIADHLSRIDDGDKDSALKEIAKSLEVDTPPTAPPSYRAMSWDQVRDMINHGISLGAHTVTHPVLSRVDSARADWEIRESAKEITTETGLEPKWFCYPQGGPGDFLVETVALVGEAGYRGCYKAYPDPRHDGNPLTLPRYGIAQNRVDFRWVLCGAEYLVSRWKTRSSN